jgi:hypothetical protein
VIKEGFRIFDKTKSLPKPGTHRHPAPEYRLFKESSDILTETKVYQNPSCSSCCPGSLNDQDDRTSRTKKSKLLDLGEMKVCFSGLTLTQNPNPQKNKSCLRGLGFRVRVSPEKQTFGFGGKRKFAFVSHPTPSNPPSLL